MAARTPIVMLRWILLGTLAALTVGACGTDEPLRGEVIPEIRLDEDPGLTHVHGLGVNPADDLLYVATHFGLWRVDDGEAERVGGHYLDLMGFTVVGADHFLASGHPPLADELPPNLGLMETVDAGRTWASVSLLGSADFHALRHSHGKIWGWDTATGELLVTEDGERWDTRAAIPVLDFVVHPDDPQTVLAVTATQVGELRTSHSGDAGRSWEEVDAPPLVRLAWEEADRLFAVDADGTVWRGTSVEDWEPIGTVGGFPEALHDAGDAIYVAAAGVLAVSFDDGTTWETLLRYH